MIPRKNYLQGREGEGREGEREDEGEEGDVRPDCQHRPRTVETLRRTGRRLDPSRTLLTSSGFPPPLAGLFLQRCLISLYICMKIVKYTDFKFLCFTLNSGFICVFASPYFGS